MQFGSALIRCILVIVAISQSAESFAATKRKPARKAVPPPVTAPAKVVPAPLKILRLSQLPVEQRLDLQPHDEQRIGPLTKPVASDCPHRSTGRVAPCLGIPDERTDASDVRLRFELSRTISGAPQGTMFVPCSRRENVPCSVGSDLQTDQEKLAGMLNQGKRTPQANLGLELSF